MAQNKKKNNGFMNTDSNRSKPIISEELEETPPTLPEENKEIQKPKEKVQEAPKVVEPQKPAEPETELTPEVKPVKKPLKQLKVGETLIGEEQGKFNGHPAEFKIYYGNFIKPMVENPETHEYEFKVLKDEVYRNILNEFLSSPEGYEYETPSQIDILEACRIVKEKEDKYIENLRQAKIEKQQNQQTVNQEAIKSEMASSLNIEGEQPKSIIQSMLPSKKKQPKQDIEEEKEEPKAQETNIEKSNEKVPVEEVNTEKLRYVDDVKSYTEMHMEKYRKMGFSQLQLEQIEKGLNNEIDVSYYAHVDFTPAQMETLRKKLQAEVGVPNEAKTKFNQDYFDEKEKRNDEILSESEENNTSILKAFGTGLGILVFSLVVVALLIMVITILIKAFKTYSTGLFWFTKTARSF